MSDLAPTSLFDRPDAGPTSQFDVSSIDANLRSIMAVEGRWRMPPLPDEVKLDLAALPGVQANHLTSLLSGLDSDLNDDEPPVEENPLAGVRLGYQDQDFNRSRFDQIRVFTAGIAAEKHPTDPTVDAVRRFKADAISRGMLEAPEGELDSRWSPELNRLRSEMAYDDQNSRLRGARPGAVPTNRVLDLLGKWTSPSGLLAAATDLDLFWDFGAIDKEWTSWGDKWRKLSESKSPLDFGKNLVDALTGPVDDVVFPVANWALMLTGLGSVTNAARIGWAASKIGQGGRLVKGLYLLGDVGNGANIAAIGERSWTAGKLLKSSSASLSTVGKGMEAWRAWEPVKRAKSVTQLGMRLGFTSQLQDLMPGYQGGLSASSIPGIGDAADDLRAFGRSPLATPIEILAAPYNIWSPGTFLRSGGEGLNAISRTATGLFVATGSVPGRAALGAVAGAGAGVLGGDDTGDVFEGATIGALGAAALPALGRAMRNPFGRLAAGGVVGAGAGAGFAVVTDGDVSDATVIGALTGASVVGANSVYAKFRHTDRRGLSKMIGATGDFLAMGSFKPIAEDQQIAMAFHKGMRGTLTGPELERYDRVFRERNSFLAAFADHLGVDEETAAGAVGYVTLAAAIDYTASAQARLIEGEGFADRYHFARNKLVAQLRGFDLDNPSSFTLDDIARAAALGEVSTLKAFKRRFEEIRKDLDEGRALELAAAHNDNARRTIEQLLSVENMPDLSMNVTRQWGELAPDDRLGVLETYLPQALPTFGNWPQFTAQTDQIGQWMDAGVLDDAVFVPATNRFGRSVNPINRKTAVPDSVRTADQAVTDSLLRDPNTDVLKAVKPGRFSPLARLFPEGRFTVQRLGSATKQEIFQRAEFVQDLLDASKRLEGLNQAGVLKRLETTAATEGLDIGTAAPDMLKDLLRLSSDQKFSKSVRYLHSFTKRHEISWADLKVSLDEMLDAAANDAELWGRYGLDQYVRADDGSFLRGRSALEQRLKQLRQKEKFTAAEIDTDQLVASVRASQGDEAADELAQQISLMTGDGYRLVHGVEYLMPNDLTRIPAFRDIGTRHMNAATLGNFFKKRLPAPARLAEERRQRLALVGAMADRGIDIDPEDERIGLLLQDLYTEVLRPEQDSLTDRVMDLHNMNFWQRKRLSLDSTFTPLRLEDLTTRTKRVRAVLENRGWSDTEVDAVIAALPKFRNAEFKDLGLYAFEAKLRQRNELVQALKFFSGTKYGEGVWARGTQGRRVGALGGFYQGYASADAEASGEERLGRGLVGGVVGGAAGTALVGGASKMAAGAIDDATRKAELFRFGQLGDQYARMRDALRFTLSPMFDISRYTEGLMLGQTAGPLRTADGTRLALPLDLSPSGARRRLAKQLREGGMDSRLAQNSARARFNEHRQEFIKAGRGDYDPEILDPAGKWFAQIGIMGFNPTDWMTAAFSTLRAEGFSAEDAYRHVREMYTYGTRGRSPAEMSVNFVFFPFSFQKKALTHIGKWMNDDLSRSIMIHDALKAYEALDERYDLDEFWKDHVPALRQLNKLNLLAFGVSPGRFGGMNAQLLETGFKASMALFIPTGVGLRNEDDALEIKKLVRSLTPALNDINWMLDDLKETQQVVFSSTHQTTRAQIRDAYSEWNDYRSELGQELDERGLTWSDLYRQPYLEDARLAYESKRAEIGARYPGWRQARAKAIFNIQALEMEKNDRLAKTASDPANAPAEDLMLFQFENELQTLKARLSLQGVSVEGPEGWLDAPAWAADYLLSRSVEMREENPRWYGIWRKFYEDQLGPIEAKI
jgi:hypothetical protein